jgi:hypothetical protein
MWNNGPPAPGEISRETLVPDVALLNIPGGFPSEADHGRTNNQDRYSTR